MSTRKQRVAGPNLQRSMDASLSVIDEQSRRFRLSFSSELAYLRSSWFDEPWIEILGHDDGEIDLSRLASGRASLLWGHDDFSRDNNIGVIEKAWVEKGRGYADVRMSMRSDLDGLWRDVVDEIVQNVSTSYQILERTLWKQNEDGPDEYRVTRWLPLEISLVSIPVDDTVGVGRSAEAPANFTITNIEERTMADTTALPGNERAAEPAAVPGDKPTVKTPATPTTAAEAPVDAVRAADAVRQEIDKAVRAERARTTEIRSLATKHNLGDTFIAKHEADGSTVDAARAAALDELATRSTGGQGPHVAISKDQVDKLRSAAEDWLMARSGQKVDGKPIDVRGNEFRGMTLMDLARDSLSRSGQSFRGLDSMEVAKRALTHSTSDFPIILGNVFNKILLAAYTAIPDTWRTFSKVGSLSDFRDSNRYRMGTFGQLDLIPEGGEYKYGKLSDAEKNAVRLATKGKMFSVTRQLLINDDLSALVNILELMGRGAKRGVEIDVYAALASNGGNGPKTGDGVNLFDAAHSNLAGAGAAPSITTIPAAQQAMQSQIYGDDFIDIAPSIFLSSIPVAAAMKVLNASQYDPTVNKFQAINPIYQAFSTIIGTPRISGNGWYMFADPNIEPVLEVDFLNGNEEPYTEQREGWNVDGIEYKVRFDYGVNAVGYRGAYRNPGA